MAPEMRPSRAISARSMSARTCPPGPAEPRPRITATAMSSPATNPSACSSTSSGARWRRRRTGSSSPESWPSTGGVAGRCRRVRCRPAHAARPGSAPRTWSPSRSAPGRTRSDAQALRRACRIDDHYHPVAVPWASNTTSGNTAGTGAGHRRRAAEGTSGASSRHPSRASNRAREAGGRSTPVFVIPEGCVEILKPGRDS